MRVLRGLLIGLTMALPLAPIAVPAEVGGAVVAPRGEDEGLFPEQPEPCEVELLGTDLSGNRHNGLPLNRLQVVLWYDGAGAGSPELRIGIEGGGDIVVDDIAPFGRTVETREFELSRDCRLSGQFEIEGLVPNGVVDGLAFGILWKDATGTARMVKSAAGLDDIGTGAFVGMWPLGFSRDVFAERTPQLTDPFGRESARAIILGAELLPGGAYDLS